MPLPRALLLGPEAFEDRTVPSGGFRTHGPGPYEGDTTPAVTREHRPSADRSFDSDGPAGGGWREFVARSAAGTEAAVVSIGPARAAAVPAVTASSSAAAASSVPAAERAVSSSPVSLGVQLPPDATAQQLSAATDAGERTAAPGRAAAPNAVLNAVRAAVAESLMVWTGSAAPSEDVGPAAPVLPDPVPSPRSSGAPGADSWAPIEVDLPALDPLVGRLRADAAVLEARLAGLLDAVTGIDVDAAGGDGWLGAAAALAGAAGYLAWANRKSRPAAAPPAEKPDAD